VDDEIARSYTCVVEMRKKRAETTMRRMISISVTDPDQEGTPEGVVFGLWTEDPSGFEGGPTGTLLLL
jgi:hypothetical protein